MPLHAEDAIERREEIRKILGQRVIRSQSDLLSVLGKKGYAVTQSSVSRDLHDLNVVKVDGRYILADYLMRDSREAGKEVMTDGVRDPLKEHNRELYEAVAAVSTFQEAGPYLLVLKLSPGRAQLLAVALDAVRWPEVVGTVAGDDTVFVAVHGKREQAKLKMRLLKIKEGKKYG